jgi:hypothetical protein
MGEGSQSYAEQWQRYRYWVRMFWGLFLGWLPFGAVLGGVALLVQSDALVYPLLFAYAVAWVASGIVASNFRCPRCGKTFFWSLRYRNPFARQCVHCHLPKWAGSPYDRF